MNVRPSRSLFLLPGETWVSRCQESPDPGTGPRPVRTRAAEQEVSSGWASRRSSIGPCGRPRRRHRRLGSAGTRFSQEHRPLLPERWGTAALCHSLPRGALTGQRCCLLPGGIPQAQEGREGASGAVGGSDAYGQHPGTKGQSSFEGPAPRIPAPIGSGYGHGEAALCSLHIFFPRGGGDSFPILQLEKLKANKITIRRAGSRAEPRVQILTAPLTSCDRVPRAG